MNRVVANAFEFVWVALGGIDVDGERAAADISHFQKFHSVADFMARYIVSNEVPTSIIVVGIIVMILNCHEISILNL